jgi:hypothetical protein
VSGGSAYKKHRGLHLAGQATCLAAEAEEEEEECQVNAGLVPLIIS